ncbi:hypothetical protein EKO27_g7186 [Xylaria grammica]|uniref:EKC/KEOPS complex subunit BUD32 n=1 Tax=Xylaria grammica TaxID=363999 RepID=A0A439D0V5_9PEZI|nr:hypothetical protein EKO27_g7186 [Xylaria grammica]
MDKNVTIELLNPQQAEAILSACKNTQESDDTQEYEYNYLTKQWGLEDIPRYNRGGFHPIHIRDVLDDRFEVVHKLGSGGFGTVWLCRDRQLEKWRAVKVMAADHSSDSAELKTLDFLKQSSSLEELERNHIAAPLETFWIEGPNGRHLCLVMCIYGYPVSEWRLDLDNIQPSTKKDSTMICAQIAQALAFLHGKGVCHGDFRPSNILMKLDQEALHKLDPSQMAELLGVPEAYEVQTVSGKSPLPKGPEYCVLAVKQDWCEKLLLPEIAVIDFGESFSVNTPRNSTGIPTPYAAPEVLFNQTVGTGVDIWSLACTIYEVRTGDKLFGDDFYQGAKFTRVVYEIEIILGPLVEPYRKVWEHEGFGGHNDIVEVPDESGGAVLPATCSLASLESGRRKYITGSGYNDILEAMLGAKREQYHSFLSEDRDEPPISYQYEKEEVVALADLLRRLFKYHPGERLGAYEVLQHPWIKDSEVA